MHIRDVFTVTSTTRNAVEDRFLGDKVFVYYASVLLLLLYIIYYLLTYYCIYFTYFEKCIL